MSNLPADKIPDMPHARPEERILVATLIDYPVLWGELAELAPRDFTDVEARKIVKKMAKIRKAGRDWLRSDFLMINEQGTVIQPGNHTAFPEYVKRVKDASYMRRAWDVGKDIAAAAMDGDVEALRKAMDPVRLPDYPRTNGRTPSTWAEQAAIIPKISWLWKSWLPIGLLSMIVGAVEVGKSALEMILARAVICGGALPDGTLLEGGGRVVWYDTENAEAINHERANLWGVSLDKILVPSIDHDPLSDVNLLDPAGWDSFEAAVRSTDVRLAIVDSLGGAYLRENDPQIKLLVKKLGALSRDAQVAMSVVHHPRKLYLGEHDIITLDRIRGHSGIVQFARVISALEKPDPGIPDTVRCKVIKSNLGKKPESFGFEISDAGLSWTDAPEEQKQETQLDRAVELLETFLKSGPVLASEAYTEGEGAGIGKGSIRRAQKVLHISSRKNGQDGHWYWSLPSYREPEPYIPEN